MLKSLPKKNKKNLDQKHRQRLETDIAQLINENNSLRTQITHLNSELDYIKRDYGNKNEELESELEQIDEKLALANQEASDIINKAYRNADIIIKEVLSAAYDAMDDMTSYSNLDENMSFKMEFKLQHLEHMLSGISDEAVKNLILFNKDHDTFFKR